MFNWKKSLQSSKKMNKLLTAKVIVNGLYITQRVMDNCFFGVHVSLK